MFFDRKEFILRTIFIVAGAVCIGFATGNVLLAIGVGLVALGLYVGEI